MFYICFIFSVFLHLFFQKKILQYNSIIVSHTRTQYLLENAKFSISIIGFRFNNDGIRLSKKINSKYGN